MTSNLPSPLPVVSILIPCLNEKHFIGPCLDSLIQNDYPKDKIEILVIDGISDDGTLEIIEDYCRQYPYIKLLKNPGKTQQLGVNIGVQASKGDVVMRLAAHSTFKENYVTVCIEAMHRYGADDVGGRWVMTPRDKTLLGKAICFAASVRFGVGNAYYRLVSLSKPNTSLLSEPRWGVHSIGFCCRRDVLEKVGLLNEHLERSEDIDWWARLQEEGFRTLFVPSAECHYQMRTQLDQFVRHMFLNGKWVLLPLQHSNRISFSLRHIVPFLFLSTMLVLSGLSFFSSSVRLLFIFILASYLGVNLYYSFRIALREKDPRYFFVLPFVFATLHISYGLGSVVGFFQILKTIVDKLFTMLIRNRIKRWLT